MTTSGRMLTDEFHARGVEVPKGYELTTLAQRPGSRDAVERLGSSVWPELMLKDTVSDRHWTRMAQDLPDFDPDVWIIHDLD